MEQWAPNVGPGKVSVPLEAGGNYYFIDSVVGGCENGRKLSVRSMCVVNMLYIQSKSIICLGVS